MPLRVVSTAYGRAASECLRDAIAGAKAGEPLRPVTVVVPTNSVGVATRRRLASGELGPVTSQGRGVVGVTFLTAFRLAELLGAPSLASAGRRPVSTPVVAAAVRRVLARQPGMFRPVAEHPATEEALVATHKELADLDDAELTTLAERHARANEIVRIHRTVRAALAGDWYDESDLMRAAVAAVDAGSPLLRDLGAVVCFLPQRWNAPAARLVGTLADRTDVSVIAGLTGSARADAGVRASVARLGAEIPDLPAVAAPQPTEVVSASDADDEVRAVVRGLVNAMRDGVPLERMAVLYGPREPYARLVHEHLDRAGIAHNGARVRTLVDSVLGRSLLRLLDLANGEFHRREVCALFAAAPMRDGRGRLVPATEWERVSRSAGIVAGIGEWTSRLEAYAANLGTEDGQERERARADALRTFVVDLATELGRAQAQTSWAGCARTAHRLISRYFGDDSRRREWPGIEQEAARRVEAAIDRLSRLDAIDDATTLDGFRRTFELELAAATEHVGRLGEGVLAGPVGLALGVDLDRVWVCGLAEGVFPSVPADDPLLAEADRVALGGALRLRADRVDDAERAYLAALASTAHERTCTWPRGDLRRTTEHVVSRYLQQRSEPDRVIASYVSGLAAIEFAASPHELGVRAALASEPWVGAEPEVARARELIDARASARFTRFDGNVAACADALRSISPLDSDRAVSPTRLETWASCPYAYFLHYVLHVEPLENPDDIMQLSPLDRGSIMHEILDAFVAEGPPFDRARLRELAEVACAAAEARGITGRALLWRRDRRLMFSELDTFFDADEQWRAPRNATTLATELSFGFADSPHAAVELEWPDGRHLLVRGKADRIDQCADGRLVVIDYKTGKPDPYTSLNPENPVDGGLHLQLPIYARAAQLAYGPDAPVEAMYWFVGRGNNRTIGYDVDAEIEATFSGAVRAIVDGIEAGMFMAMPAAPGPRFWVPCDACEPDGMGTADRWREWERKFPDPELDGYRALRERVAG